MGNQSSKGNEMRGKHFEEMLGIDPAELDAGKYCFLYYFWWTDETRTDETRKGIKTPKKDRKTVHKPVYDAIFEQNDEKKDQELISIATDNQLKAMSNSDFAYVFSPGGEFNDDDDRSKGKEINTYRFYKMFKIIRDSRGNISKLTVTDFLRG